MYSESEKKNLQVKKLEKEIELLELELELELKNLKGRKSLLGKRISWLVAFATIVISVTQIIISDISARKEIQLKELENQRRYDLDLLRFVMDNQGDIFSPEIERRTRIRNIMYATLPQKIIDAVFLRISETAENEETRFFWKGSKNLSIGIIEIDSLIRLTQGTRENTNIELWTNNSKKSIIADLLKSANYSLEIRESENDGMINSLRYDKNMSLENIKLIALLMLNSKIELKEIKQRSTINGISHIVNEPFFKENPVKGFDLKKVMDFKKP